MKGAGSSSLYVPKHKLYDDWIGSYCMMISMSNFKVGRCLLMIRAYRLTGIEDKLIVTKGERRREL